MTPPAWLRFDALTVFLVVWLVSITFNTGFVYLEYEEGLTMLHKRRDALVQQLDALRTDAEQLREALDAVGVELKEQVLAPLMNRTVDVPQDDPTPEPPVAEPTASPVTSSSQCAAVPEESPFPHGRFGFKPWKIESPAVEHWAGLGRCLASGLSGASATFLETWVQKMEETPSVPREAISELNALSQKLPHIRERMNRAELLWSRWFNDIAPPERPQATPIYRPLFAESAESDPYDEIGRRRFGQLAGARP